MKPFVTGTAVRNWVFATAAALGRPFRGTAGGRPAARPTSARSAAGAVAPRRRSRSGLDEQRPPAKVVVEYHARVAGPLRKALSSLARRPPNGPMMARLAVELIRDTLTRTAGELPDALLDTRTDPALYWWEFSRGFWIAFVRQDRGWWWWRRRQITIHAVAERRPTRVAEPFHRG
jgi:hypothetical protein